MAKKAELLEKAASLGLEVSDKNTVAEIEEAITKAAMLDKVTEDTIVNAETAEVVEAKNETSTKSTAKAGKRSAKALKAAEEQAKKEERKAETSHAEEPAAKPKVQQKPARPRIERQGKKFREAAKQIDKSKTYKLSDALELAVKTSPVKFDATVEMHFRLNVDPRQADQNIRGTVVLPAGTGKSTRVAVFSDDKVTGADLVGVEAVTKLLDKGQLDFDVLIATPANMPKLGKYARVLGPRGLMPNPKSGTVTTDIAKAVQEAKAGRVEYRVDSTGIVHVGIGKVSFGAVKLAENAGAMNSAIKSAKPASIKGNYVKSVYVTTSMGPSILTMLE